MSTSSEQRLQEAHDRAAPFIGRTERVALGRIHAREVARFAIATGDPSPVWSDESAAREAGYAGVPVPPLYLTAVLGWGAGPREDELMADGNALPSLGSVPLDGLRLMGGGQQVTVHHPVLVGTDVVLDTTVERLERKQGRSGPLLIVSVLRHYRDDMGLLLVECRESFLALPLEVVA